MSAPIFYVSGSILFNFKRTFNSNSKFERVPPMKLQLEFQTSNSEFYIKGWKLSNSKCQFADSKLQKSNLKCQISESFLWQTVKFQITFPLLKNSLTPISRYLLLLRNSAQSSVIATRIPQTIHRQARSYVIEISGRSSCSLKSYMNQRWRTTSWYIRRRLLRSQTRAARAVSLRWQPSWICGAVR